MNSHHEDCPAPYGDSGCVCHALRALEEVAVLKAELAREKAISKNDYERGLAVFNKDQRTIADLKRELDQAKKCPDICYGCDKRIEHLDNALKVAKRQLHGLHIELDHETAKVENITRSISPEDDRQRVRRYRGLPCDCATCPSCVQVSALMAMLGELLARIDEYDERRDDDDLIDRAQALVRKYR